MTCPEPEALATLQHVGDERRRARERRRSEEDSLAAEQAFLHERVRAGELTQEEARLALLERRWQVTRSPEDEAILLAERLRAFELPPSRLRLAAALGHSPAELALRLLGRHEERPPSLESLLQAVDTATHRAALAAARLVLRRRDLTPEGRRTADEVLAPLQAWLACPCPEHLVAADAAARHEARTFGTCLTTRDDDALLPVRAALFSAGELTSSFGWRTPWGPMSRTRLEHAWETIRAAGEPDDADLQAALREELVPWLLDRGEPRAGAPR
ncbi:MAG: hypothetical protein M9894_27055 [Planctomycetes bacterium]|nr:hypothetical protein [Planctomycetota bacterium]